MQPRTVHRCANGMTSLVWEQPEAPVVSVQVWVETGSAYEGAYAGSGISHLVEHMVFKGTAEYSASKLGEAVSAKGGVWNAYTSTNRTVFHIDGVLEHWRSYLHILAQLTLHPTFPAEEWELEREVIRREMAMYRDDPNDASYRALIETLFRMHPRRLPVIGERELFDALTPEDLRAYHKQRYVPRNMFVCIAGAVKPEEVNAAVEEEFGCESRFGEELPTLPVEPRQWGRRLCRREFPQTTSTLMLGWRTPDANHPDAAALAMLSCILGDGRTAWLYKVFHDERALAHDISTTIIPQTVGEGAFVVEADVDRELRDELRDALLHWLEDLPTADFAHALKRALRQQNVRTRRAIISAQGAANLLGVNWMHTRNVDAHEEWLSALECVTPQDLQRVAAQWLQPQRLTEVSIDPVGSNAQEDANEEAARPQPHSEFVLPNGLRCVVRVDRRLPMVHASLVLGAGCRVESKANAGICTLLAECLPKGTTTRSCEEIAALAEDMGGLLLTQAGNNTLMINLRSVSEEAPAMLELLADVALRPAFPAESVKTAREDLLAEIQDEEDSPVGYAFRRLRELCFGDVSYGHAPGGERESVSRLTRDDLVAMHARLMCGCNAVLSLSGDLQPDVIEKQVRAAFAAMPAGRKPTFVATPPQRPGDVQLPAPSRKEQAVLAVALPSLPLDHPDQPLLELLDEWCQDMTGPIFTEVREKRGLAYHASSALMLGVDAGCIYFSLETSPELLPAARAALDETLAALAENGMPPEALERAKATSLSAKLIATQSIWRMCSEAAINTLLGLGADYTEQSIKSLSAVQPEQMQAFIRRILSRDAVRTYVTLLPT